MGIYVALSQQQARLGSNQASRAALHPAALQMASIVASAVGPRRASVTRHGRSMATRRVARPNSSSHDRRVNDDCPARVRATPQRSCDRPSPALSDPAADAAQVLIDCADPNEALAGGWYGEAVRVACDVGLVVAPSRYAAWRRPGALEFAAWLARAGGLALRLVGAVGVANGGGRDASRLLADASLIVQRCAGIVAEPVARPGVCGSHHDDWSCRLERARGRGGALGDRQAVTSTVVRGPRRLAREANAVHAPAEMSASPRLSARGAAGPRRDGHRLQGRRSRARETRGAEADPPRARVAGALPAAFPSGVTARSLARSSKRDPDLRGGRGKRLALPLDALRRGLRSRTLLSQVGTLPRQRALAVLSQLAGALDAAHGRGLVHRDVKPSNVLLDRGDHAYLSDFGLSKKLASADATNTGQFVGTFDYLAPEHIRGEPTARPPPGRAARGAQGPPRRRPPRTRAGARAGAGQGHPRALRKLRGFRGRRRRPSRGEVGRRRPSLRPHRRALPRQFRSPPVIAAGVLLAAIVAALVLSQALGGVQVVADSAAAVDPASGHVAVDVRLGGSPAEIAAGSGRIWILSRNGRTLWALSPTTAAAKQTIGLATATTSG